MIFRIGIPLVSSTRRVLALCALFSTAAWLWTCPVLASQAAESAGAEDSIPVLDIQRLRIHAVPAGQTPADTLRADLVVNGGGLGGLAATLAACEAGRTVILCEETDWLGGQVTSQGVSALDESQWVEQGSATAAYLAFREGIRDWYRERRRLRPAARADTRLNPGNCWVSRLAFEPEAALAVIDELLAPHLLAGRLRILLRQKALRARRRADRILWVEVFDLESLEIHHLEAEYFLAASELGDLLPLAELRHVIGAEPRAETGEPHARDDGFRPMCIQPFTYSFVLEHHPGESHLIPEPAAYASNRREQPYSHRIVLHDARGEKRYAMLKLFERTPNLGGSFWNYRRILDREQFEDGSQPHDYSLINWPTMDYRQGSLLSGSAEDILAHLEAAKRLSLGFLFWLQTDLRHDRGLVGYPGLKLNRELLGSEDGLAKYPYIRESRRAVTVETLREQDISAAGNPGRQRGRFFDNSIGVGQYDLDFHRGAVEEHMKPQKALPFQLPLGILLPRDTENLIPAGKTVGVTHITNAATRLHPVEWAIGEAAGALVSICLEIGISPRDLHADAALTRRLQESLVERGVPIYWYPNVPPGSDDFARAQFAAFASDSARLAIESRLRYLPGSP